MGKSKELFMKYQESKTDLERGYFSDDLIARAWQEEEYEKLKMSDEMNESLNTKIIVSDDRETRIEIGEKEQVHSKNVEIFGDGFQ